ncbi:NADPH-dependent FMN reductase [Vibrio panuliri]|uniref:NADPH-dependent FMN reductase n=1 Tax=Vibrio panuliri TaxID=1381081 RepID=A0ABX3FKH3_9VIBR|nr:NADPH-dependent FMN reductase [Vibrio panuliri]KAB1454991.1 NAD(P)H-dependent oxidoreductase [Vibrio panuliri]OLQ94714.1 NADPH-dependent FMN reductase [Vibrio panuliri]
MLIVAFGASTSSSSINRTLANYAAHLVPDAQVKLLDLNDYHVPIFSEDMEKQIGQSEGARAFLADISQADALIISFAEHNGAYTAAYKNLFDWASRIEREVFQQKPAVYLATSPGPGGASNVLAAASGSASYFGAQLKASLSVPSFYDNFDLATGKFSSSEMADKVRQVVTALTAEL